MIITKEVKFRGKMIPVNALSKSSTKKVKVKCPNCNNIRSVMYRSVIQAGHYLCLQCVRSLKQGKPLKNGSRFGRLTVIDGKPSSSTVKCKCGNITEVNNYNLKSGKTKSCGCLRVENILKVGVTNKGKNHGRWNGGSSTERERFMQTKEYKNWRSKVFKRDDYTCFICSTRGYDIVAHHIKNYSEYKNLRVEVNNGVTMCNDCHVQFHKKYGYSNNNLNQMYDFKGGNKE